MWKIDTERENILAIMKIYHYRIISLIIECPTTLTTSEIHGALESEGISISRASVINYCKLLADNGIVGFRMEAAKGGYRRVYSKRMTWESILEVIHNQVLDKMTGAFPDSEYLKNVLKTLTKGSQ